LVTEANVNTAEMLGKCGRLRRELAEAFGATPRNLGYIRRLAAEIDRLERLEAGIQPRASEAVEPEATVSALDRAQAVNTRTETAAV
jgi:hypothetical protein